MERHQKFVQKLGCQIMCDRKKSNSNDPVIEHKKEMVRTYMKNILPILLAILLLLSMVGCGEYNPALEGPGKETDGVDSEKEPDSSEDLKNDPDAFTVSIRYDGKPYIPKAKDEMKAQWTDGFSFHTADFADDGIARVSGLDGDYQVTLRGLPEGYLYNPNAYVATNNQKNIIIDIYKPIRTSGYGTGPFDCINIKKTGVYRVELTSAEHKVFFQYAPSASGTYSVESWLSTAEGNYNPMVDVYTGSVAYKTFAYTLNDGGFSAGYTQNFKHIVEIADEQISDGGQAVFTFAVHADSKNGVYPVYVDIAVQLNGSFSLGLGNSEMIIPTEEFFQTPEYHAGEYTFTWAETSTKGVEGRFEYNGDMFALWEKGTGMPMNRPDGSAQGNTLAERLKGFYQLKYTNLDTSILREIEFSPVSIGAVKGTVLIKDYLLTYDADGNAIKSHVPKYQGTYSYEAKDDDSDATTPEIVQLTYKSGDEIDYAAFTVTKSGTVTYGKGDGYYHLCDKENGTYGAILYAKIDQPHRFTDADFTHIEDPGNKSLTIYGTENHKLFIQGLLALLIDQPGDAGMYFCLPECPCMEAHTCKAGECENPCEKLDICIGVCGESCPDCLEDCRNLPDWIMEQIYYCHPQCGCAEKANHQGFCEDSCEDCTEFCRTMPDALKKQYDEETLTGYRFFMTPNRGNVYAPIGLAGYASYTNSDGVYAVTEEVRHFLQGFSVSQRYFADGQGWVESNPTVKVDATENDQWLFACGYYVRK